MTAKPTYQPLGGLAAAAPFWLSLSFVVVIPFAIWMGGAWLWLVPLYTWGLYSLLDGFLGLNLDNVDPGTSEKQLFWFNAVTWVWPPIQFLLIFGAIWHVTSATDMSIGAKVLLMFGIGVASGTVGINYSHELMHQKNAAERWLGDLLLAMVLYSHFRSEHLLVHHSFVGTPRDTVTAKYNEGFHRFFPRVLWQSLTSALRAETARQKRSDRPAWHKSNPFWRYLILQAAFVLLAFLIGGVEGILLFALQAFVAIWQLELVNYVEHYGLTRKHLGEGRYEHVKPHHSWNAAHKASNWLLINLQRHSDHHYKPDRRFPLLQTYSDAEAPQLTFGYPVMTALAMTPPLWRHYMNPKVRKWRAMYYPDIVDWQPYKDGTNPSPRGAS